MKAIVIYDSVYGNTEKIARCIADALAGSADVAVLRASQTKPDQLVGCNLLIVGSPTQQFRAIAPIQALLKGIAPNALKGVKVAAFDTRLAPAQIEKVKVLAMFVKVFGYAAKPIADSLVKKGGELAAPPEGFLVSDTEGPLVQGELERAGKWATRLLQSA